MDRGQTVQKLFDGFCKAYPLKSRQANQDACHAFWRSIKDKTDCDRLAQIKLKELQSKANTPGGTLMNFFKTAPKTTPTQQACAPASLSPNEPEIEASTSTPQSAPQREIAKEVPSKYSCPKQDKVKKELEAISAEIGCLLLRERNAIMSATQEKELKSLQIKKRQLETELTKLKYDQDRQKQFRTQRKRVLEDIADPTRNWPKTEGAQRCWPSNN